MDPPRTDQALPAHLQAALTPSEPAYNIIKFNFNRPVTNTHDTGIILAQTLDPIQEMLSHAQYYVPEHLATLTVEVRQLKDWEMVNAKIQPHNGLEILCYSTDNGVTSKRATISAADKPNFDKWIKTIKPVFDEAAILNLANNNPVKRLFRLHDFGTWAHSFAVALGKKKVTPGDDSEAARIFIWSPLDTARGMEEKGCLPMSE